MCLEYLLNDISIPALRCTGLLHALYVDSAAAPRIAKCQIGYTPEAEQSRQHAAHHSALTVLAICRT